MAHPSICLVVPCRDDAAFLERCLRSFTTQTAPLDGIVVVDNASTDNTAEVARRFGAHVVDERRVGITWAAAAGYDAAAELGHDIILRTDADAWADPGFVATLRAEWDRRARSRKRVVGLMGRATFDLPVGGKAASALYVSAYRLTVGSALGHAPFFGTDCSFTTSWWREVRDDLDLPDTTSHDDIQLSFAVRPHETVRYAPALNLRMDSRPLRGAVQLRRRFARGWHSVMRGFGRSAPPRRLVERWTR
ncbi:glycosyltransferase family 2 protein [Corynebacterium sp.]|uniref:glycosyltransferase family 2 protein n=1 Tax=Corynebacterium sp. TaxID=1720 RepID=UPI002A91CD18|nr:glycosyltransferase family 2 protein [Corynebacterium sp.]MDY5786438.1 glycosyltransferase family 2 protein [Corynebacterium sp.]